MAANAQPPWTDVGFLLCPAGERPLSAQSDEGAPVESCQEPPALHGVKSPARLATSSGGLVIVHDRPSGEPPELLARPRGLPSPGLDPARCRWSSSVMRTTQGASFATNEANCVQAQTDRAPATPTPRPDRPQHSLHHFTDHRLPNLPHLTITSSPSTPPSDCSTRVALEEQYGRRRWRQRWFRLPLAPGAQSQQPSEQ